MPPSVRALAAATPLVALGMGLVYLGADTGPRRDPGRNAPVAEFGIDEKFPMDDELEHRRQVHLQRFAVKDRAVRKLLAEELTLLEAATRFREVERTHPVTWGPPGAGTGPADAEHLCRAVIALANAWMEQHVPAAAADTTARLKAELEQLRGPDGTLRLPD